MRRNLSKNQNKMRGLTTMFETLFQVEILQKIIINSLLVSIPEEIYLVMFTLILLGEFDYWREPECKKLFHRFDIMRILLPATVTALLLNTFKYLGISSDISTYSILILFYVMIVLTNNIFKDASALKWMGKMFVFFIIGYITVGLSELIYIPLIQFSLTLTIEEINNDLFLNFLVSIPAKIIQLSILMFLIAKKRALTKNNIFKYIFANPILSISTFTFILLNLLFLWVLYKLIVFDQILINFSPQIQFLIVIFVIVLPLLNISVFFISIYYIQNKELRIKKIAEKKLINVANKINNYSKNKDVHDLQWKLNEISIDINNLTKNFYSEDETVSKKDDLKGGYVNEKN